MAIGPSTTQAPYLVAGAPRVAFTSISSATGHVVPQHDLG